jgi:hypothetical protein
MLLRDHGTCGGGGWSGLCVNCVCVGLACGDGAEWT